MRVFRIEDSEGEGIFTSGIAFYIRAKFEHPDGAGWTIPDPFRHPTPMDDVPGWTLSMKAYYCCFASMQRLVDWFDSEKFRAALVENGCEVVEYEIDEALVLRGGHQEMFHKAKAERIGTVSMPMAMQAAA
jgi:hypothetical protein